MKRAEYIKGQLIGKCNYVEDAEAPAGNSKPRRYAKFECRCGNTLHLKLTV